MKSLKSAINKICVVAMIASTWTAMDYYDSMKFDEKRLNIMKDSYRAIESLDKKLSSEGFKEFKSAQKLEMVNLQNKIDNEWSYFVGYSHFGLLMLGASFMPYKKRTGPYRVRFKGKDWD